MNLTLKILFLFLISLTVTADPINEIRLNQVGYYTNGPKLASVVNSASDSFSIQAPDQSSVYFKGKLSNAVSWNLSGENVKTADFTLFTDPGDYIIVVKGMGYSYPFTISDNVFMPLNKALVKAYYFNRASTALEPKYAGKWSRAAGHPDNEVVVHAAAASAQRPAGTKISSPKGWYDAGDYNSYIVNSGISTYSLLISYEHFKTYFDTLNVNIPESANQLPDILDEIKWNLDWMLTMQDPNDGGVYNKKTNAGFDDFVMPEFATDTRYVVQKSTSSACDFAAVMAVAYRIYKEYDATYAATCLEAAKKAYAWGVANPNVTFSNPRASGTYPEVRTGGYGDGNLTDELEWAGNELYIATKVDSYYKFRSNLSYEVPNWGSVRTLGLFSLVHHRKNLTNPGFADTTTMKNKLTTLADSYVDYQKNTSPYKVVMGVNGSDDFVWGSNSQAANQGMILLNAYFVKNNIEYLDAALSQIDYTMGKNALGFSYVTGFGTKRVMNPHHRPSGADNITDPVPGWVIGGPTNASGDGCPNESVLVAKSFTDGEPCYTKTEVAINWNAPAVYLTGAFEFLKTYNSGTVAGLNELNRSKEKLESVIYPVPATDHISVEFNAGNTGQGTIEISGSTGTRFLNKEIMVRKGKNNFNISVSDLNEGIYIVMIKTGSAVETKKITISKK